MFTLPHWAAFLVIHGPIFLSAHPRFRPSSHSAPYYRSLYSLVCVMKAGKIGFFLWVMLGTIGPWWCRPVSGRGGSSGPPPHTCISTHTQTHKPVCSARINVWRLLPQSLLSSFTGSANWGSPSPTALPPPHPSPQGVTSAGELYMETFIHRKAQNETNHLHPGPQLEGWMSLWHYIVGLFMLDSKHNNSN